MPSINQRRQLNPRGTTEGGNGIHGGPATPTGVEHIVDEYERAAVQIKREFGQLQHADPSACGQIIPMHGDIHNSKSGSHTFDLGNVRGYALGDNLSPCGNAGDHQTREIVMLLDDLMGYAANCLPNGLGIHHES